MLRPGAPSAPARWLQTGSGRDPERDGPTLSGRRGSPPGLSAADSVSPGPWGQILVKDLAQINPAPAVARAVDAKTWSAKPSRWNLGGHRPFRRVAENRVDTAFLSRAVGHYHEGLMRLGQHRHEPFERRGAPRHRRDEDQVDRHGFKHLSHPLNQEVLADQDRKTPSAAEVDREPGGVLMDVFPAQLLVHVPEALPVPERLFAATQQSQRLIPPAAVHLLMMTAGHQQPDRWRWRLELFVPAAGSAR